MAYEMTGTVQLVKDTQTFPSGFQKRELVVQNDEDRFPSPVMFSFTKERIPLLDDVKQGERVKVSFDIRGREYNGRHFVDLNGFRLERLDGSAPGEEPPPEAVSDEPPLDDSMPF